MLAWLLPIAAGGCVLVPTAGEKAPAATASAEQTSAAPSGSLPETIRDYYADHNLVHAFSTPEERARVVLKPAVPLDGRMQRIARLMAELSARTEDVDPGMISPGARRAASVFPRTDLFEVRSWSHHGDLIEVRLEALELERSPNILLVQEYGSRPDGWTPSFSDLAQLVGSPMASTVEVHRWRCVDGAWKRSATTTHFLAD
jgi:hypothetical protein